MVNNITMKPKIIIGNWKMNKNLQEVKDFFEEFLKIIKHKNSIFLNKNIYIAPSYPFLLMSKTICHNYPIQIMAQNIHHVQTGSYTGEVSVEMIKSIGINSVIIGHSERRIYNNETNNILSKKTQLAFKKKMKIILCIGENLEDKNKNNKFTVLKRQIEESINNLNIENDQDVKLIHIAYEPVWLIGGNKKVEIKEIKKTNVYIKNILLTKFHHNTNKISILYGGNVNLHNIKQLSKEKSIDGFLIGRESLIAENFMQIIKNI